MVSRVAVVVLDGVAPFELGVLCEVFGTDRTADGLPGYEFSVCSPGGATVRTSAGFNLVPDRDLAALEAADLIGVPAHGDGVAVPVELADALRRAERRGAYIVSLCTGAFMLGDAGLLDGRQCT